MGYGKVDRNAMKEKYESGGRSEYANYWKEGDLPFFVPQEHENQIRLLPPFEGVKTFSIRIYRHWTNSGAFLCPQKMQNKPCPLCEEYKRLKAAGAAKEVLKPFLTSERWIMNVIDRKNEDKGVQIMDAPPTIDDGILGQAYDRRTGEILDITDPEAGYDVFFDREGKPKDPKTKYKNFQLDKRPSSLGDESWLNDIYDIKSLLHYASYDEIKASMTGGFETDKSEGIKAETKKEVETKEDIPYDLDKKETVIEKKIEEKKYEDTKETTDTDAIRERLRARLAQMKGER